jgi:hypothetical protein
MLKWLHHLLEPHCPDCKAEREDNAICKSCETLRIQLEIANYEKRQLNDAVIRLSLPPERTAPPAYQEPQPARQQHIPWAVRRQMLEAESRREAQLINARKEEEAKLAASVPRGPSGGISASVAELEQELGITEQGTEGA